MGNLSIVKGDIKIQPGARHHCSEWDSRHALNNLPASVSLWLQSGRRCWLAAAQHDVDVTVEVSDPLSLTCRYLLCAVLESNRLALLLPLLEPAPKMGCVASDPIPVSAHCMKRENSNSFPLFLLLLEWDKSWSHLYHCNPGRNSRKSLPLHLHGYNWEQNPSPHPHRWLLSWEKY